MSAKQEILNLVPPFTREIAEQKVRKAEEGWTSRDPQKVAQAYTTDSHWRNRAEFATGREEIAKFLTRKWQRELNYRLIKEFWDFDIHVRFEAGRIALFQLVLDT